MSAKKLSRAQLLAIPHLAAGSSIRATADTIGVSERSIRRWLRQPEFAAALREAEKEVWNATVRKLRALGERAVRALGRVLEDPGATPSARIQAARAILDGIAKAEALARLEELEDRVRALEERMK